MALSTLLVRWQSTVLESRAFGKHILKAVATFDKQHRFQMARAANVPNVKKGVRMFRQHFRG